MILSNLLLAFQNTSHFFFQHATFLFSHIHTEKFEIKMCDYFFQNYWCYHAKNCYDSFLSTYCWLALSTVFKIHFLCWWSNNIRSGTFLFRHSNFWLYMKQQSHHNLKEHCNLDDENVKQFKWNNQLLNHYFFPWKGQFWGCDAFVPLTSLMTTILPSFFFLFDC